MRSILGLPFSWKLPTQTHKARLPVQLRDGRVGLRTTAREVVWVAVEELNISYSTETLDFYIPY